jgi:hypothetical protein
MQTGGLSLKINGWVEEGLNGMGVLCNHGLALQVFLYCLHIGRVATQHPRGDGHGQTCHYHQCTWLPRPCHGIMVIGAST